MTIKRLLFLTLIATIVIAACTTPPTPTPAATGAAPSGGVPRLESTQCWFKAPASYDVECSYLIVPEDHARPDGATIKLAVARFKSEAIKPESDPIIYLEGGPGGSPLKSLVPQFAQTLGPLVAKRDVIVFDQRGTGYSQPALDCPELLKLALDTLDQNLSAEQSDRLSNQALLACHDRLAKAGVNLSVYTSAQNAADIAALQKALGYDKVNLYGISYGTRLALTAMRDVPQGIRSVVIDSVFPPQVDLYSAIPADGARAFNALFDACAKDANCNATFPDLKNAFFQLVDKLNQAPIKFTLTLKSGEKKEAVLNGDGLVGFMFQSLYATPIIPYLPRTVLDIRDGNYALMAALQAEFLDEYDKIASGMQYSVQCGEEVAFDQPDALDAVLKQNPAYAALAGKGVYDLCKRWGMPAANPLENQAVTSDIPTLVLSGQFDPITPPAWGELTTQTLPKSFFFLLPFAGHGASLIDDCPRQIMQDFLGDPTKRPDDACLNSQMATTKFALPLKAADIKLVDFTEAQLGIGGKVPEDWKPIGPGIYSPNGKATDATAILQQAAPIKPDAFLNLITNQVEQSGTKIQFEQTGTRSANGLSWTLYSAAASISSVDVAFAESNGVTYIIFLQSILPDRKALYDAVFLPAVDAFKPR